MAFFKYQQLIDDVIAQIDSEQLTNKLPSVRALARHRNISTATVVQAYHELERRGWILAKPKQGFFVNTLPRTKLPDYGVAVSHCKAKIPLVEAVQFSFNDSAIVPLSCTAPSTVVDNEALLNRLYKQAFKTRPFQLIMDDPIEGLPSLRKQLASHLSHAQGRVSAAELLITNGRKDSLQIALLASNALQSPIAVESPTSFYFQAMLSQYQAEVIEVPMQTNYQDELALLSKTHQQRPFKTYLVNPNFADPTGRLLCVEDKRALLVWSVKHQVTLIEYDRGELYFGANRPVSLTHLVSHSQQHINSPDAEVLSKARVISIGDFYDTVSPTFSLGYLHCKNTYQACLFTKQTTAEEANVGLQQMMVQLMSSGQYMQLVEKLRQTMRQQMHSFKQLLSAELNTLAMPIYISQPSGGPCLWCKLPSELSSAALWDKLIQRNVAIAPGSMFTFSSDYDSFFRVTFALPWNRVFSEGVTTLGKTISEFVQQPTRDNG
ncbi:PLP-dependent aminotransferase family protein [Shewanella maritima]|uniref:aminotransferase-like domain-containing protein n=1 Tax=Shewanella maritima TaxID=2520507 RepID=UPI003735EB77